MYAGTVCHRRTGRQISVIAGAVKSYFNHFKQLSALSHKYSSVAQSSNVCSSSAVLSASYVVMTVPAGKPPPVSNANS